MRIQYLLLCIFYLALVPQAAVSQEYPDRLVKVVVPFAAGGATDVAGRLLAEGFKARLGQTFLIENKPGASGAIGIDAVAKSRPDGYTLGISGVGPSAILFQVDPSLSYSPTRDLDIVGSINAVPFILCARDDFPATNVTELYDYARQSPGKVTFGSVGAASPNHILHEELARIGGTKMLHVPYKGEAPIINALLSHEIDIAFVSAALATEYVTAGKFKALGAGGSERSPHFPDLPTIAEQTKVSDYSAYAWTVLVAPKGLPPQILTKLNATLNAILAEAAIREKMDKLGLTILGGDIPAAQAFIAKELARYEAMIKQNNITRQ